MVGIIPESLRNDGNAMKGNLGKWKKGGLVVDVFRSTVQLATLAPEWNAYFELWVYAWGIWCCAHMSEVYAYLIVGIFCPR